MFIDWLFSRFSTRDITVSVGNGHYQDTLSKPIMSPGWVAEKSNWLPTCIRQKDVKTHGERATGCILMVYLKHGGLKE